MGCPSASRGMMMVIAVLLSEGGALGVGAPERRSAQTQESHADTTYAPQQASLCEPSHPIELANPHMALDDSVQTSGEVWRKPQHCEEQ
jgi:hypothetical protein